MLDRAWEPRAGSGVPRAPLLHTMTISQPMFPALIPQARVTAATRIEDPSAECSAAMAFATSCLFDVAICWDAGGD